MISEKLMMAVLALDSYSRSSADLPENVRIFGMGGEGASVGGATVSFVQNEPSSSFVAVSYSWNGKTVLSFRGTDDATPSGDIGNGWMIGAGFETTSQAGLAQAFYEAMTGQSVFAPASADVIMTGHSLGGGLAGFLSALSGTKAYGFDHMVFGPAAEKAIASQLQSLGMTDPTEAQFAALGLRLPTADKFTGTHVSGEILEGVRDGSFANLAASVVAGTTPVLGLLGMGTTWLLASMGQAQLAYENNVVNGELSTFGWNNSPVPNPGAANALHSQALLVLLQFAQDEPVGGQWISSGFSVPLLNALYKDSIATNAGIFQGGASSGASGTSNPADLMLTKIAYTVLESGNRPFGDSAIRSLFNDAESVGNFLNDGGSTYFDVTGIADMMVLYAALQAQYKVSGQGEGFIGHQEGIIVLDYRASTWTFGDHVRFDPGIVEDFSDYLDDGYLDATELSGLGSYPRWIDAVFFSNTDIRWTGQVTYESTQYTVQVVTSDLDDDVTGTGGSEHFLLNDGDDRVTPGGGINWVDGGDGDDTLVDSFAWSDFEVTTQGDQYFLALRNSETDPRIHVVKDVEFFELGGQTFDTSNLMNVGPNGSAFLSGGVFSEGTALGTGAEVARLEGFDGNVFDILSFSLHADSLRYFYLEGNVVRARHSINLDWSDYSGFLGANGLGDLEAGVSASTWWTQDVAFMDSHYVVKVHVTDSYGVSALTNLVLDVKNSAPVISVPNVAFPENAPAGRVLGTASGTDPDSPSGPLSWSLAGSAAHLFAISSAGVITTKAPIDYEQWVSVGLGDVFVVATDRTGLSTSKPLNFSITNVNEAPTALSWINGGSVVENASPRTVIGTLVASDPENNVSSYKISGWSSIFEVIAQTMPDGRLGMVLRTRSDAAPIDYETLGPSTSVLIEVRDTNGATTVFSVPVAIIDVPEIDGLNGNDQLVGTSLSETIHGWGGDDHIWGMGGDDLIYGDAGNDTLYAGDGRDILYGGADNDTFVVDTGDLVRDIFYGGTGTDTVWAQGAATFDLTVAGIAAARAEFPIAPSGTFFAVFTGTSSALVTETEIIRGGTGSSIVVDVHPNYIATVYGIGTVNFIGGGGSTATFNNPYLQNLNFLAESGYWHTVVGYTTFDGIETWNLGSANTVVKFVALHNAGAITVDGGTGNDVADFSAYIGGHTYDMNSTELLVGQVTIKNFNTIRTGSGNDTFIGNSQSSRFEGGTGKDTYVSREGVDCMMDPDHAVLDYSGSNTAVTIQYIHSNGYARYQGTGGHAQGDQLEIGAWNALVEIIGSNYADNLVLRHSGTLIGGEGNDILEGSIYNDTLDGGTGFDTLKVSGGNDTLIFSSTGGRLNYAAASSSIVDLIAGVATATIDGTFKTDTLAGRVLEFSDTWGTDIVTGTDLSETLYFSGGNDTFITGGGQRDTIFGMGSGDTIRFTGGAASMAGIAASQLGSDVLLDFLGGSILLKNTAMWQWQNIQYEFG